MIKKRLRIAIILAILILTLLAFTDLPKFLRVLFN